MTHEGILQGVVGHYEGVPVILSLSALEPHESFRWPYSRHRSQRVHKKLTKRLGPQLYRKPAIFKLKDGGLIMHPEKWRELSRITKVLDFASQYGFGPKKLSPDAVHNVGI